MSKHTPGPWETWGDAHVIIRKPNRAGAMVRGTICSVGLSPRETNHGPRQSYPEALAEQAANARLIAAAPKLLEALQKIAALQQEPGEEAFELLLTAQELARAAIAKAEPK